MSNRVTLRDIADKLEYSKNKISLALHNSPQISQGTKERIQRATLIVATWTESKSILSSLP